MKTISRLTGIAFVLSALLWMAGPQGFASEDEVLALSETKINLIQAINAAEKHQGGQAFEASLDDDSFKPTYEVAVAKNGTVYDVRIDGVTGEVLGSREDKD
jgi:uncharacterized membrane protein YkoI